MLESEITALRRKLAEVNSMRAALMKSIEALEGANSRGSPDGTTTPTSAAEHYSNDGTGQNGTNPETLRDAVRMLLSDGSGMSARRIRSEIESRFPRLMKSMSGRALETCLYKLQQRKEIQAQSKPGEDDRVYMKA